MSHYLVMHNSNSLPQVSLPMFHCSRVFQNQHKIIKSLLSPSISSSNVVYETPLLAIHLALEHQRKRCRFQFANHTIFIAKSKPQIPQLKIVFFLSKQIFHHLFFFPSLSLCCPLKLKPLLLTFSLTPQSQFQPLH